MNSSGLPVREQKYLQGLTRNRRVAGACSIVFGVATVASVILDVVEYAQGCLKFPLSVFMMLAFLAYASWWHTDRAACILWSSIRQLESRLQQLEEGKGNEQPGVG
jgi:presenilin-like A22 family membrane protease